VRISTGTDEENQIAVEAIEKQMKYYKENRYAPTR
jgi:histidinol-phosphate/aromatic aminotransferase/cobyric acid decarboxylase-like protein